MVDECPSDCALPVCARSLTLFALFSPSQRPHSFDPKLAGEPAKKAKKVKTAIAPVADKKALGEESKKMQSILSAVLRPKGAGAARGKHVNIDALEPAAAGYNRKKGRGAVKKSGGKKKGKK